MIKSEAVIAKPLEVKVRGNDFDQAQRAFKSLVQKDGILALYKQKQTYEKKSDKLRRKMKESIEKVHSEQRKQTAMASGEWERQVKKKLKKKEQKAKAKSVAKEINNV